MSYAQIDPLTYILGSIGARDQTQITAGHSHAFKVRMGEKKKAEGTGDFGRCAMLSADAQIPSRSGRTFRPPPGLRLGEFRTIIARQFRGLSPNPAFSSW